MAQQKFVPQTNSKFLSLDLNLEEPLAEEEQFWDVICPRERGFFFLGTCDKVTYVMGL